MRHRNGSLLTLALVLALAATLAPRAGADPHARRATDRSPAVVRGITFSGTCSGPIGSEIRVNGATYRVSPAASFYEIGRGTFPAGTSFFDRNVTVSATSVRGTLVVHSVVVRPLAGFGVGGSTGVVDANSPR